MQLSLLIEIIIVLVALMLVGYVGAKRGIFTPTVTKAMSALVFNVFLVSSCFASICDNVPEMSGGRLVHIMLVLGITIILPYVLAYIACRIFFRGDSDSKPTAELCMSVMNTLMFGLPIVQQVYGGESVLYMGLSSVTFNLILYSFGVWRLLQAKGGGKVKIKLGNIFTPIFVSTIAGLVFLLLDLPIPSLLKKFMDSTSVATLPMSMIVIGATMGAGNLLETFSDRRVYLVCLVRLIISPLIVWLALSPITSDPMLLRTAVVIAGCPCGVVVSVLSLQYDQDALFASRSVMASTLLSVITLPVLIMLLG